MGAFSREILLEERVPLKGAFSEGEFSPPLGKNTSFDDFVGGERFSYTHPLRENFWGGVFSRKGPLSSKRE